MQVAVFQTTCNRWIIVISGKPQQNEIGRQTPPPSFRSSLRASAGMVGLAEVVVWYRNARQEAAAMTDY